MVRLLTVARDIQEFICVSGVHTYQFSDNIQSYLWNMYVYVHHNQRLICFTKIKINMKKNKPNEFLCIYFP